jgi:outer membrane protein assembly factor BamB
MANSKIIYIGIKGSILALDTGTGRQVWATELKGNDFVSVLVEGEKIFAATCGEVFCLDHQTGRVLWHNELKGFGCGLVSIATDGGAKSDPVVPAAEKARRDAEAAATAAAGVVAAASSR